jgi:hypothetical protein
MSYYPHNLGAIGMRINNLVIPADSITGMLSRELKRKVEEYSDIYSPTKNFR